MNRLLLLKNRSWIVALFLALTTWVSVFSQSIDEYKSLIASAEKEQDLQGVIALYAEMFDRYDAIGDAKEKPMMQIEYAILLSYAGEYDTAIAIIEEALAAAEDLPNEKMVTARGMMQLGLIYFFMEQYDEAEKYYLRAENLSRELNSDQGLSIAKNNLANIQQKRGNYQEAIVLYEETLDIQTFVKDSSTICNTLFNIGTSLEELGEFLAAKIRFEKAHAIACSIGDKEIEALALIHLGMINKSAEQLKASFGIVEHSGHKQVLHKAYEMYAKLMAEAHNYPEAYTYMEKATALSATILKDKTLALMAEYTSKLEDHEREVAYQVEKTRLQILLWGAILVALLLLYVVHLRSRSNRTLRKVNALKDSLLAIVSHDVKNPLLSQKRILETMVEHFEKLSPEETKTMCTDLLHSSRSLLELLHSLLLWTRLKANIMVYNPISIPIGTLVSEVEETLSLALQQKELSLQCVIPKNAVALGDYQMLSIVVRNLLGNAVKYSNPSSTIELIVESKNAQQWQVRIVDHGVGISPEKLEMIFGTPTSVKSDKGTMGEDGTGLGLLITQEMVKMNRGELSIESKEGEGTSVCFTLRKKGKRMDSVQKSPK